MRNHGTMARLRMLRAKRERLDLLIAKQFAAQRNWTVQNGRVVFTKSLFAKALAWMWM